MTDLQAFYSKDNKELLVIVNKSNIQLALSNKEPSNDLSWKFDFDILQFQELVSYLESQANKVWKNFAPKEENSIGSDYGEYYDREFDNNGYLQIKGLLISATGPWTESERLYQFSKRKLESFLFDCKKNIKKEQCK